MCLIKHLQHGLISRPSRWHSLLRLMNTVLYTYLYKRQCHSWSKPKEITLVNKMFHVYLSRSSTHTLSYCYWCIWIARGQASQQFDFCSGLPWGSLVRFYNRADGLIRESLCGWILKYFSLFSGTLFVIVSSVCSLTLFYIRLALKYAWHSKPCIWAEECLQESIMK